MALNIFRYRFKKLGGHYHVRVFSGVVDQTFAKMGTLVMDEDDFLHLQEVISLTGDELLPE